MSKVVKVTVGTLLQIAGIILIILQVVFNLIKRAIITLTMMW